MYYYMLLDSTFYNTYYVTHFIYDTLYKFYFT